MGPLLHLSIQTPLCSGPGLGLRTGCRGLYPEISGGLKFCLSSSLLDPPLGASASEGSPIIVPISKMRKQAQTGEGAHPNPIPHR